MGLSPDEIRGAMFPMVRRGFDPMEVRYFLQAVAEELQGRVNDQYEAAGQEIASVLRAAHEEATKMRSAARSEAEAIRSEAEMEAAHLRSQAEEERDQAKRLLARARERSDQAIAEAEERAAKIISDAEARARNRVSAALDAGRRRLAHLAREEQQAQQRLLDAQAELETAIQRITGSGPIIDLTGREPVVRPGKRQPSSADPAAPSRRPRPTPEPETVARLSEAAGAESSGPALTGAEEALEARGPAGAGASPDVTSGVAGEPTEVPEKPQAVFQTDPLTAMVRRAVGRAVESSAQNE